MEMPVAPQTIIIAQLRTLLPDAESTSSAKVVYGHFCRLGALYISCCTAKWVLFAACRKGCLLCPEITTEQAHVPWFLSADDSCLGTLVVLVGTPMACWAGPATCHLHPQQSSVP